MEKNQNNFFVGIKNDIEHLNNELEIAFEECNPDEMLDLADELKEITRNAKTDLAKQKTNELNQNDNLSEDNSLQIFKTAENSLNDLKDLILLTKGISNHLYGQLISVDVADPNLIAATAEFIKSTRESISDFIQIYRDEREFFHKAQLAMIQFNNRKELIRYKHELDNIKGTIDIEEGSVEYNQEKVMDALNSFDKNDK